MSERVSFPPALTAATPSPAGGLVYNPSTPLVASTAVSARPMIPASASPTMNVTVAQPQVMTPQPQKTAMIMQPATIQQIATPTNEAPTVVTTHVKSADWGFNLNLMSVMFVVFVFIIVFLILLATKPNMVTNLVNGSRVLSNGKLMLWTVILTVFIAIVAWMAMYLFGGRRC